MNPANLIDTLIAPLSAGFVVLARLENPGAPDSVIIAQVEGDLKHSLRQRLGWAVDFLWGISAVKTELDREIAAQVAAANDPASAVPAS